MRLPRVKDIAVALLLGYFKSLAGLLPYDFDSFLVDTDKIACNGWRGRRGTKFDLPGMTTRVDNSGYASRTAAMARLLSNERFCPYSQVRKLTVGHRGSDGGDVNSVSKFRNGISFAVLPLQVVGPHARC